MVVLLSTDSCTARKRSLILRFKQSAAIVRLRNFDTSAAASSYRADLLIRHARFETPERKRVCKKVPVRSYGIITYSKIAA